MATSQGTVKKTPLTAFSRPRTSGIIAVDLKDNDRLVGVALTDGQREVILCTSGGRPSASTRMKYVPWAVMLPACAASSSMRDRS